MQWLVAKNDASHILFPPCKRVAEGYRDYSGFCLSSHQVCIDCTAQESIEVPWWLSYLLLDSARPACTTVLSPIVAECTCRISWHELPALEVT